MTEIIDTQETTRKKKQYVRPQITMIPMQAEHALLAGSDNHNPNTIEGEETIGDETGGGND
ncbi:hypothetical protein ABVC71_02970 [Prevotella amnii]|uniref:hypothetical protein n=1 Tax=Prevotellaceae TaxID=171552 RepID=UPI00336B7998